LSLVFFALILFGGLSFDYLQANSFFRYIQKNQIEYKLPFLDFIYDEKTFLAVGDVSYSRAVERAVKNRDNLYYPFEKTKDEILKADFAFANLETTVMDGRPILDNEMVFRSNVSTVEVLKNVGFDLVSLANNHTPDFREKGIVKTMKNLDSQNILHSGLGLNLKDSLKPTLLEVDGYKLAVISFLDPAFVPKSYGATLESAGTAFMSFENLEAGMRLAKESADLVFVSMHAGSEYVNKPNQFQIDFARKAIDLGAEVVIGHHPHVVQSMEKYKGKYIFYSLGNFVFDQPFSFNTKAGIMLKLNFNILGVRSVELLPYFMHNFVQPEFVEGELADKILKQLNYDFSSDLNIKPFSKLRSEYK